MTLNTDIQQAQRISPVKNWNALGNAQNKLKDRINKLPLVQGSADTTQPLSSERYHQKHDTHPIPACQNGHCNKEQAIDAILTRPKINYPRIACQNTTNSRNKTNLPLSQWERWDNETDSHYQANDIERTEVIRTQFSQSYQVVITMITMKWISLRHYINSIGINAEFNPKSAGGGGSASLTYGGMPCKPLLVVLFEPEDYYVDLPKWNRTRNAIWEPRCLAFAGALWCKLHGSLLRTISLLLQIAQSDSHLAAVPRCWAANLWKPCG